jgi:hypothetical protein
MVPMAKREVPVRVSFAARDIAISLSPNDQILL